MGQKRVKMKHFLSVLLIFGLIALNFECTDAASEESDGSGDSEESDESDEPKGSGDSKESDESERTWGRRRGSRRRRRRFGFGSFGSSFRRLRFQCLGQCRVTGATTCSVTPFPSFFNPNPAPVTYQCSQLFPFGILTG